MAQSTVNVNGTPQVFNNVLLSLNGDTTGFEINGYIKSIRWSTGTRTDHVKTLTTTADPLTTNSVSSSPAGSITFVSGAFSNIFKSFVNDRFTKFTLQFIEYTTGNIAGPNNILVISSAQLDDDSGTIDEGSPSNMRTIGFKATNIQTLITT